MVAKTTRYVRRSRPYLSISLKGMIWLLLTREQRRLEIERWQNRLVRNCAVCNGTGYVMKPNSGKAVMCECQERALLSAHLVASGVPRKYVDPVVWNWDNIKNNRESTERVKRYAEDFESNYRNGRGLYLYGQQGRGKSVLESLAAREIAARINPDTGRHYQPCFVIYEELIQTSHHARHDINAKNSLNTMISRSDVLIIDNVGSETGSREYSTKFLEFVLRKRDNDNLPVIVSSNLTPEQLAGFYSDTVADFIEQNCEYVIVKGDNFRRVSGTAVLDDPLLTGDVGSLGTDVAILGDDLVGDEP